jgi:HemY protein
MPVSPVTGRLDAFEWKVPVAEIGIARPPIEPDAPLLRAPVPESAAAKKPAVARKPQTKPQPRPAAAETVIPLVHAPDDPGPDAALESDPVPEASTPRQHPGWQRFLRAFR